MWLDSVVLNVFSVVHVKSWGRGEGLGPFSRGEVSVLPG